jgi:hypothetical protein
MPYALDRAATVVGHNKLAVAKYYILRLLGKRNVHYRLHNISSMYPNLSQTKVLQIMKEYFLNINANNIPLSRDMVQAVSRRPLTAESQVRARENQCGIYDG